VHRDIKPSNIIFVNGVPKLADIGLVAALKEAHSYVGTEGFIPAEGPGTPQADLYSLGKVLYEVSTGKDRHEFPELPTHWSESPEYEGLLELNEVILHSCNQNAARRYATAWEMHAELLLVLNGKSVRRLRMLERRWVNLKRVATITAGIAVIAAAVLYNVYREWRIAGEAKQRRILANTAYGNRAMDAGDLFAALPYFAEVLKMDEGKADREPTDRLRLGSVLAQCPKLSMIWFGQERVNNARVSPDGRNVLFARQHGKVSVCDLETGKLYRQPFGPARGLRTATYSPDGRLIVTSSESTDFASIVWDAVTLEQIVTLPHPLGVMQSRFSPDGHHLVTASLDGNARIWNMDTYKEEQVFHAGSRTSFADYSHNGQLIATCDYDGMVRVWRTNGEPTGLTFRHSTWATYVAFSPNDKRLVAVCHDHKAYVWDLMTGERIYPPLNHDDAVVGVEFSPDGRLILTSSFDGTARLWRAEDLQPLASNPILRHEQRVTHASFSPDGRRIITTCIDGTVRVWDLAGITIPPVPARRYFCGDGSHYATITNESVQVWDAVSGELSCPGIACAVQNVLLNYNGQFVLTTSAVTAEKQRGGTNYALQVWDSRSGMKAGPAILTTNSPDVAALSENGQRLVIAHSNVVQSWDVPAGRALSPEMTYSNAVSSVTLSPLGEFCVTVSGTSACIWRTEGDQPCAFRLQHPVGVVCTEISRDSKYVVTSCSDEFVNNCFSQVWDAHTGLPVGKRLWHADGVLNTCFSRDAKFVLTASEDYTARIWETATGREVGNPLTHQDHIRMAAFNSNATWVVTGSDDKTARLWDAEYDDPLTPPLRQLEKVIKAQFLADGRHIVTFDKYGMSSIWSLPIDKRPVSDLVDFATLLSGGRFSPNEEGHDKAADRLEALWKSLHTRHVEDFVTSPSQVIRWHQFQVEEAESQENWPAAVFHLKRLLSLNPGDTAVSTHLATVTERLKSN